jgi:hypothetical protein
MTVSGEPSVRRPRLWPVFVTFTVATPVAIIAVVDWTDAIEKEE